MGLKKQLKELFLNIDLFQTTEYFRYKSESKYRTYTGAVCSVVLIIIFVAAFTNIIIGTLSKAALNWNYQLIHSATDELFINTTTKQPAKFMFAVGIADLNLNEGDRYFDLKLQQAYSQNGVAKNIQIPLSPCQRSVWEGADTQVLEIYDRNNFSRFLCPPEGQTFDIAGSKIAKEFKYMKVSANKCNSSLSSRPCVNESVLQNYLLDNPNFYLNFYFVNGLLNPANATQISFYLQDRNYVPFNLQYGGLVNLFMSRYSITTDESIMPYQSQRTSQGGIVNYLGQYIVSRVFRDQYASILLRKSTFSWKIMRNYKKLDNTLSYIGGLFGFLMIAFVFMNVYTSYCYQVEMGDRLYHYDNESPLNSNKFNFFTFMGYLVYCVLKAFGCPPNWQIMKRYDECRQEIKKQFDICFLMKRIIFFERSIRILFEDHQFKGLHMNKKLTLKEAQQLRSFYRLRDKIKVDFEQSGQNTQVEKDSENEENNSNIVNITQQFLENNSHMPEAFLPIGNSSTKSKMQHGSFSRKVFPETQMVSKSRGVGRTTEIMVNPKQQQFTQIHLHNRSSHQKHSSIQNKLKLLHKQSESGNPLSKKIFDGVESSLIKAILLKIEQNTQEGKEHDSNIIICQNQNQFQIRITKNRDESHYAEKKENHQQEKNNSKNIEKKESSFSMNEDLNNQSDFKMIENPDKKQNENMLQSKRRQKQKKIKLEPLS